MASTIISCSDLVKVQGTSTALTARLLSGSTPLSGKTLVFTIHGVSYNRVTNSDGYASLNINLGVGAYPCTVRFDGDASYSNNSKRVNVSVIDKYDAVLSVSDLSKTWGTATPLTARLTYDGSPLVGKSVRFNIHGVSYNRVTDSDGYASLNINLDVGAYSTKVTFDSDNSYKAVNKTVIVRVMDKPKINLIVSNFTKTYGTSTPLTAKIDIPSIITGLKVYFTIHGVTYERLTDVNGEAKLNINLSPGVYPCTVRYAGDNTYSETIKKITVTVKADTWIDGTTLNKMVGDSTPYQCAVYDQWQRLMDASVDLTIHGVTYTRKAGADGLIKLNINLQPGEYPIEVKFNGDTLHNPSTRLRDIIIIRPKIAELSARRTDNAWVPGPNTGHMETKIYTARWSYESNKERNSSYVLPTWDFLDRDDDAVRHIKFTSYEIIETDPRVKTAKFTTNIYLDLTAGVHWVYIASPYHENFGGKILNVNYDKSTKLYTYQCQDGRRQYMNKRRTTIAENYTGTIYDMLETCLVLAAHYKKSGAVMITPEMRQKYSKLLSGLHPIGDYTQDLSEIVKNVNNMNTPVPRTLSYDRLIDKIMNYAHLGGNVDVWFDPSGVCHIDPINLNEWLNTGIRLTHQDLVSYKYSFDTTNILTGITVQDPNSNDANIKYDEFAELVYFFGANVGLVSPVTTQITTESSNGSSSSSSSGGTGRFKGKTVVVGCDRNNGNDSALQNTVVNKIRNAGYNVEQLPIGPNDFANYDWHRNAKGKVGVYIMASSTLSIADAMSSPGHGFDYYIFVNRDAELGRKSISGWNTVTWGRDSDCNSVCNGWAGLTSAQIVAKMGDRGTMVGGNTNEEMANNTLAGLNGDKYTPGNVTSTNTTSNETKTTTTTVIDEDATYRKVLEEMSKSVRDLLSFSVRVPLNSPIFKNLHTNMMLWTQLPTDFKLMNLEKVFKILPAYKVNRGIRYMENRWYVEGVKIKGDTSGCFADITLNPFPSDYSSYTNAIMDYEKAYDQAYKQKTETTNNAQQTSTTSGNAKGSPRLGNDSTDTGDMAAATGRGPGHAGTFENFDSAAQKGYAQQGRKYFEWARQFNDPMSLAKALVSRFNYVSYSNHRHSNAEVTHNNGSSINCNCWDAARYVKCCFDAAGFDCIVVTGYAYGYGHGWNSVKWNGRWYAFDLCFPVTGSNWAGTNAFRMTDEW